MEKETQTENNLSHSLDSIRRCSRLQVSCFVCCCDASMIVMLFLAVPDRNLEVPSPAVTSENPRKVLNFEEGAAARALVEIHQSPGYIRFPRMRLVVVHEKYWLAILNKDKLIEFRSSNHPILLQAGHRPISQRQELATWQA